MKKRLQFRGPHSQPRGRTEPQAGHGGPAHYPIPCDWPLGWGRLPGRHGSHSSSWGSGPQPRSRQDRGALLPRRSLGLAHPPTFSGAFHVLNGPIMPKWPGEFYQICDGPISQRSKWRLGEVTGIQTQAQLNPQRWASQDCSRKGLWGSSPKVAPWGSGPPQEWAAGAWTCRVTLCERCRSPSSGWRQSRAAAPARCWGERSEEGWRP